MVGPKVRLHSGWEVKVIEQRTEPIFPCAMELFLIQQLGKDSSYREKGYIG